jgi:hypothetical protein
MKVFVTTAVSSEEYPTYVPVVKELSDRDRIKVHTLSDEPEDADVILFVDGHMSLNGWRLLPIRQHPLTIKYPHKTLIYNESDRPWCALPGIYVSMPRSTFNPRWQRSYGYLTMRHNYIQPASGIPDLLFSFIGAMSHKVRDHVLQLSHPRACVEDSKANFFDFSGSEASQALQAVQKRKFAELIDRSKFVLCPRGQGVSSIRLFEVMAAGRVPVIISDEWVAPSGPRWDEFSIRVLESKVGEIPRLLEERENQFETMAVYARAAYLEWFAADVMFHQLVENCAELICKGVLSRPHPPVLLDPQYLRCGLNHSEGVIRTRLGIMKRGLIQRLHKRA